ncbi:MAG TPA: hypothetical protein VGK24_05795 [Candidatus Angelobacter sp.]|jgi:hypothetical protein
MPVGTVEQGQLARQELATKNQKIISTLPEELRIAGDPIKIFNVSNQKWEVSMGGLGTWTIHACEKGQAHSEPLEVPFIMNEGIMVDMEHIEFRAMAGMRFAESIIGIGQHRHPTEDLRRWGIFVAAGSVPTEEELAKARSQYRERQLELVSQGDGFYGDGPAEYKNITKAMREAIDWLVAEGVEVEERPWHKMIKAGQIECPGCFQKVDPRTIAHIGPNGCGWVLNEEEVIKRKMRGYEHLWLERTVTHHSTEPESSEEGGNKASGKRKQ